MPDCTIVIPCYNEAQRLNVRAFQQFAESCHEIRFLLVNAGSTDDTHGVLRRLHASAPARFVLHELPRNAGKAEAVRQGICRALEDGPGVVGFWDADLATPLNAVHDFLRILHDNPSLLMVFGARVRLLGRSIERRTVRHYLSRLFATATSLLLGLPIYDTQCGAKLFRVCPEVCRLFERPFVTNWVFDVELLARYLGERSEAARQRAVATIYELPLTEWCDVAGSKVKPWDFFKAFFELARIYRTYLVSRPRRHAK